VPSMSRPLSPTEKPGGQTRLALMQAGIKLFGEKGFEATSTREIAAAAEANIASIAYHFGGKDGLRLACAAFVGGRIQDVLGPALGKLDDADDPAAAQASFETVIMTMADFMLGRPEAREIAAFLLSEMARPGIVLDRIYTDFILPVHTRLCTLLGLATGRDPESDLVRIGTFSIAGQVVYFRISQPIVARRMGWDMTGPEEIAGIKAVILGNIRAFIVTNTKVAL
jgi:AcrR family transcriptional regulator